MAMARVQTLVQLTDDLLGLLDARAAKQGVSRSQVIRQAIEAYLRDEREDAVGRAIIEGYTRIPPGTPDEWGDLEAWHDALAEARARQHRDEEW